MIKILQILTIYIYKNIFCLVSNISGVFSEVLSLKIFLYINNNKIIETL